MSKELWKKIPFTKAPYIYEVSNLGRIRRAGCRHCGNPPKPLQPFVTTAGRHQVTLFSGIKVKRNYTIHRLVMHAFVGLSELTVNHKDGNPKNNALTNLEYMTLAENIQHCCRVLKRYGGPYAKRTLALKLDVPEILSKSDDGYTISQLSREYSVSRPVITKIIKTRQHWTQP